MKKLLSKQMSATSALARRHASAAKLAVVMLVAAAALGSIQPAPIERRDSEPLPVKAPNLPAPKPVAVVSSTNDTKIPDPLPEKAETTPEHRFHPIIDKAAKRYDIDPALVKAIIKAESGYNARAVSKKGAMGLMQLMPGTARELGVEDSFNPEHNINGGVKYFRKLMDRFDGDLRLALAAYNAGSKKVRRYQGVPPFKVTRYYIQKVIRYYQLYKSKTEDVDNA